MECVKRLLDFFLRRHQPDIDALSAHLDGRLDVRADAALQSHLADCGACRERLDELRAVRTRLRGMPAAEPARSFRLSRPAIEAAAPRISGPAPSLVRLAPALSAAAVLVFAIVVAADVYSSGGGTSAMSLARQSGEAPQSQRVATAPAAGAMSAPESSGAAPKAIESPAASGTASDGSLPPAPAAPANTAIADNGSAFDSTPSGNSALSSRDNASNDRGGGPSGGRIALRILETIVAAIAIGAAAVAIGKRVKERGVTR